MHGAHEEGDPGPVGGARKAAEGLAEDQVARDVEGEVVVPAFGVEGGGAGVAGLVEEGEEVGGVAGEDVFLLAEGGGGEAVWVGVSGGGEVG